MNKQKRPFYTVFVFARLNTRRFFRDRLALFFGIAFPVIFLFVFGGIFGSAGNDTSFRIALINQSQSSTAKQFASDIQKAKVFKVDKTVTTLADAREKMSRGQMEATIVLPESFGVAAKGMPTGEAKVLYTQNNAQAGQTMTAVLEAQFKAVNEKFAKVAQPFSVTSEQLTNKTLSQFDYTFAGLLGFSILGIGIFGPVNVFPELKKQGILRRLHTTPLRVWQYFVSMAISQTLIGLISIGVLFTVAIVVFHLSVAGNYLNIIAWLIPSIIMVLGLGLAIGGWARNERQAAPLANIVTFPMMFLSGTFFPRFLMPEWLQGITAYLPLTPVIDGLRLITTEGKTILDLLPQFGLICGWMIVIYIVAFRVFRWE